MGKISTAVKDQVEAGLVASDGPTRVLVTAARYEINAKYNKNNREDATTLCITYVEKSRRKERKYKGDDVHTSCGPVSRLVPCEDDGGKSVEPAEGSKATGFGSSSNVSIFFNHFEECLKDLPKGMDPDDFDTTDDVSCLEQCEVTIDAVPQPERKGLRINKPGGSDSARPGRVVIWKEIHGLVEDVAEWRGGAGGGDDDDDEPEKSSRSSRRRRGKPSDEAEQPEEKSSKSKGGGKLGPIVVEVLEKLLPESDDAIDLEALAKKCFPIIKKNTSWNKQRSAILAKLGEDDYLEGLDGFVVDDGELRRL